MASFSTLDLGLLPVVREVVGRNRRFQYCSSRENSNEITQETLSGDAEALGKEDRASACEDEGRGEPDVQEKGLPAVTSGNRGRLVSS